MYCFLDSLILLVTCSICFVCHSIVKWLLSITNREQIVWRVKYILQISFNGHKDMTRFTFIHEQCKFTVEMIWENAYQLLTKKIDIPLGKGWLSHMCKRHSREVIWYLRMKQQRPKLSESIDKKSKLMPVTAITWFMSVTWWLLVAK